MANNDEFDLGTAWLKASLILQDAREFVATDERASKDATRFAEAICAAISNITIKEDEWSPSVVMVALASNMLGITNMPEYDDVVPQQNPTQKKPKREYLQRTAYPDTVAAPSQRKARKPEPVAK